MQLISSIVIIIILIVNTVGEYKKIKSNEEIARLNNEILKRQKELKERLDKKIELAKRFNCEIEVCRTDLDVLKNNLSIDYDHLTEEIIKRISEQQKNRGKIRINI